MPSTVVAIEGNSLRTLYQQVSSSVSWFQFDQVRSTIALMFDSSVRL